MRQWIPAIALVFVFSAWSKPTIAQSTAVANTGRWKPPTFVLLAASAGLATAADMFYSQRCETTFATCREANPLLPQNRLAIDTVEVSITGFAIADGYALRRSHPRLAKLPLIAAIAVHGAAALWAIHAESVLRAETR